MDPDFKYKIKTRSEDFGPRMNNIPVIYEDDWFLIVDKPPGLLSIPAPGKQARTLTGILNEELVKKGVSYRLHPCHRLDKDTSGLIIYAKGKSSQKKMMNEFKARKVKKTYLAFVQGIIKEDSGRIERPVDGRPAVTCFRTLGRRGGFTVLEVTSLSGRKNQLRIHLRGIGHPLVGESKFAFRKDYSLKAKRACLHAGFLEFTHPVTKKTVRVKSRIPKDMEGFLNRH